MKKILFILHLPPPIHGASMVGRNIKDSLVINRTFECDFINLGISQSVDEIGKKPFKKIGRYLFTFWQVIKKITTGKPHLCYMTLTGKGFAFYKDALIVFILKLFGVNIIFHFHNKGVSIHQNRYIDDFLYRKVFKNSWAILLSKSLYFDIEKYIPISRVYFCPNGISDDLPLQRSSISNHMNDSHMKEPLKILFLSNLIESKGVFDLLNACKILKGKGLQFRCTFAGGEGDISIKKFEEKVSGLNLQNFVCYVGPVYGRDKAALFENSDIFVLPTFEDCFPLVLLEAMQHSLPVVSTFEGGIRDIVINNETGYLVKQKDVDELAHKLEILIKNPELRRKMGEAGRLKYEKEFTLDVFESRMKEIFEEVLNEKNGIN